MSKFIYACSEEERDALLALGLTLLKSDERLQLYVFQNDESLELEEKNPTLIFSNILTY